MSAIVCGKRSYFEELPATSTTPVSKKLRCSSSTSNSPVRFLPPSSTPSRSSNIDKLREHFPLMDHQLLEKALDECGDDIDAAIKRLHELCLGSSEENKDFVNHVEVHVEQGPAEEPAASTENSSAQNNNLPTDGKQWVELLVAEMMSATSIDDARGRAAKVLEVLERSIRSQATAEAAENIQKENMLLKQQIQTVMQDNSILKRGIQIQHERQKEFDDKNQEVQQLKELLSQYQEQLRRLEVTNYTLSMHLQQAQPNNSISGHFNRDVF